MPDWIKQGFDEYARRLPRECALTLKEIPPIKRGKTTSAERAKDEEGERLLAAIGKEHVVALDEGGQQWSTIDLARRLRGWLDGGRDVALLIGGADGLTTACRERADEVWSLSRLTFPHPLVRVVVAEQLYRSWSLLQGHPYHRD